MAIWEKLFNKIIFKDYPDTSTPLNASNMNALSDAIDGIDYRVVVLNSNLSYKGNYTGNIDDLHELDKCGGYFVQVSNASGTQPFDSQYYYLEVPIESHGRLQRATQYNTGEIKERYYTNNKWYSWTPTKQNAIHSNIAFASTGITTTVNDGGYAIENDSRRWRLHANGTNCWLHEFDVDKNTLSYYAFSNGDFKANNGDIIDGDGNKLSSKQNKIIKADRDITTNLTGWALTNILVSEYVIVSAYVPATNNLKVLPSLNADTGKWGIQLYDYNNNPISEAVYTVRLFLLAV